MERAVRILTGLRRADTICMMLSAVSHAVVRFLKQVIIPSFGFEVKQVRLRLGSACFAISAMAGKTNPQALLARGPASWQSGCGCSRMVVGLEADGYISGEGSAELDFNCLEDSYGNRAGDMLELPKCASIDCRAAVRSQGIAGVELAQLGTQRRYHFTVAGDSHFHLPGRKTRDFYASGETTDSRVNCYSCHVTVKCLPQYGEEAGCDGSSAPSVCGGMRPRAGFNRSGRSHRSPFSSYIRCTEETSVGFRILTSA
jgi:hypothetical protein